MWFVYILRSRKNGRFYTGSTNDLARRLGEHNRGKNHYSKFAGPFDLVYSEKYQLRLEARKRELEIKRRKSRKYIENLIMGD